MTLAGDVRATVLALRGAAPQRAGIAVRTMACVALPLAIGAVLALVLRQLLLAGCITVTPKLPSKGMARRWQPYGQG